MSRENISQAELVGRLGQQPELQHTTEGAPYAQLSVATSERYTDRVSGEIREKTEWHRAVAWGPVAEEIVANFKKGDSVALSGAMRINSYEKDGAKNRIIELHVDRAEKNLDKTLSKNDARLVGVVREDPKARQLDSGIAMTVLSVATRTVANGKDREDWHSVTLWGKTAEAARDIGVGDTISVNGSVRHRTVPGENGDRRLSAIDCRQFQVLERAHGLSQEAQPGRDKGVERAPTEPPAPEPTKARGRQRGKGVERDM